MLKIKDIEEELDKLISIGRNGSGYGDPDLEKADNRRIQYLMNEKANLVSRKHTILEWITVLIAISGLLLGLYQEFSKVSMTEHNKTLERNSLP